MRLRQCNKGDDDREHHRSAFAPIILRLLSVRHHHWHRAEQQERS